MTLTLLDLYNSTATQEWSMYDNDATNNEEFEQSLVLGINKAITEILYSYPFNFREDTNVIITMPNIRTYPIPTGIIKKDSNNNYCIKINSNNLNLIKNFPTENKYGIPNSFYIQGDKIILDPIDTLSQ